MLTIADIIRNDQQYDMSIILEDKCSQCGGELHCGSYVCWGMCAACARKQGKIIDLNFTEIPV